MQFELKPISKAGIQEALEKAERYRLLNEPSLAESICLDVLQADPENQSALVMLLLALTDQFGQGHGLPRYMASQAGAPECRPGCIKRPAQNVLVNALKPGAIGAAVQGNVFI